MGLAGYFVAQSASDLSMFLTGNRTENMLLRGPFIPLGHPVVVVVVVVVVEKKVLSHPTMGGVILRLGTLPEPWESENTSEDLRRS